MKISNGTWFVSLVVLGICIGLNAPRGDKREVQEYGWPLVYKQVSPGFAYADGSLRPGKPGEPDVLILESPYATVEDRGALLIDILIAILATATAGIFCQRQLRKTPLPVPAC